MRAEPPKGSLRPGDVRGQEGYGSGTYSLRDSRVGCMVTPPEEKEGEVVGGGGGPSHPRMYFSFVPCIFPLSFLCLSFVTTPSGGSGRKEKGEPTMTAGHREV